MSYAETGNRQSKVSGQQVLEGQQISTQEVLLVLELIFCV